MKTQSKLFFVLGLLIASSLSQVTQTNNLILRYSFETLPPYDSSPLLRGVAFYDTKAPAPPTLSAGKFGQGIVLNPNQGQQTDVLFTGQWQLNGTFTVTSWFSINSNSINNGNAFMKILSTKINFDSPNGVEIQYNPGQNQWTIIGPGANNQLTFTPTKYTANQWNHIAVVFNGNNVQLYLNGQSAATATFSSPITAAPGKDVTVGGSGNRNGINKGGEWHGMLDEVRVYRNALDAAAVTAIYNEVDNTNVVGNGGAAPTIAPGQTCFPNTAPAASKPQLRAVSSLTPKVNGKYFPGLPENIITLHDTKDKKDVVVKPWLPEGQNTFTYYVSTNNKGKLTLINDGSTPISIQSLQVVDGNLFTATSTATLPISIAAAGTLDVNVAFKGESNDKTVLRTLLNVETSSGSFSFPLSGLFMTAPEGGNELPFRAIVNAFGFGTNIGIDWEMFGIEKLDHPYLFDEVDSVFWKAADPSQPVWAIQLAAFGGCCEGSNSLKLVYFNQTSTCEVAANGQWSQTILPYADKDGTQSAQVQCFTGNDRFSISIDGQWGTNFPLNVPNSQISNHIFMARDSEGNVMPNTYIIGMDFALDKGCGGGGGQANCDYQDNIYVIHNVVPVENPTLDQSNPSVSTFPYTVGYSSVAKASFTGLVDRLGNALPFTDRFVHSADSRVSSSSFRPDLILMDATNNVLTLDTAEGTPIGVDDTLVNAFKVELPQAQESFAISSTFNAKTLIGSTNVGVILGSDQNNFFMVYLRGNKVYAYAELMSVDQVQVFPVWRTQAYELGSATFTDAFSTVTLTIQVDPKAKNLTGSVAFDNNKKSTPLHLPWTVPGKGPIYIGAQGRLFGRGVGAGPVAFHDTGATSVKVSFSYFGIETCAATQSVVDDGGIIVEPPKNNTTGGTPIDDGSSSTGATTTGGKDTGVAPPGFTGVDGGNGNSPSGNTFVPSNKTIAASSSRIASSVVLFVSIVAAFIF